jgi:hypothetical protein
MGYTRPDGEQNTEIREHLSEPNTVNEIDKYQNNWLNHLKGTNNDRMPFQAFKYRPGRRSDRGHGGRRRDEVHVDS